MPALATVSGKSQSPPPNAPPLSPAREPLAAHHKTLDVARTALATAHGPAARLRLQLEAAQCAVRAAQADLHGIAAKEAKDLGEWSKIGTGDAPASRKKEREAAERAFAEAKRLANVVQAARNDVQPEIDAANAMLAGLEVQTPGLIVAVMVELHQDMLSRFACAYAENLRIEAEFVGLHQHLAGYGRHLSDSGKPTEEYKPIFHALETMGDALRTQPRPELTNSDVAAAKKRWSDLAERLAIDPAALLEAP